MKRGILLTILLIVIISSLSLAAVEQDNTKLEIQENLLEDEQTDCVYYFYGEGCEDCLEVSEHLIKLNQNYPFVNVQKFEIYHNIKNQLKLDNYYKALGIPKGAQSIPAVFIGKSYFIGKNTIIELLENRVEDNVGSNCPALDSLSVVGVIGEGFPADPMAMLTFSKITSSALIDTFKTGGIALLLLLLIILTLNQDKEKMLRRAILFIAGTYLAYFFFGMGMLDFFYNNIAGKIFTKMVGISAILYAIIRFKIFFGTWEVLVRQFPKDLKSILKKDLHYILLPLGIFITGFVLSLFTFFSSSGTLILIRRMFETGTKNFMLLPLLLYYNLVFVIFFIALTVIFYLLRVRLETHAHEKGKNDEKKKDVWMRHNFKVLDFVISTILFILGIVLLFV